MIIYENLVSMIGDLPVGTKRHDLSDLDPRLTHALISQVLSVVIASIN